MERDGRADTPEPPTGDAVTVLYEDGHLLAVAKPAGLVTHPAYKHPDGTLTDRVFARATQRGEPRPWLLHRLDRETSGVVLFAKTEQARRAQVRQFERREVGKRYLALTVGTLPATEGCIEAPLRRDPAERRRTIVDATGQPAQTRYSVLAARAGYSVVLVEPVTGRTHQIRAHLASVNAPLAGDARYLSAGDASLAFASRAMLHAWGLRVRHPITGAPLLLTAMPPADFLEAAQWLRLGEALADTLADHQTDLTSAHGQHDAGETIWRSYAAQRD